MAVVFKLKVPPGQFLTSEGEPVSEPKTWGGGDGWALCDFNQGPGVATLQVLSPVQFTEGADRWIDTDVRFEFDEGGGMKHFKLPLGVSIRIRLTDDIASTEVSFTVFADTRRTLFPS